MRQFCRRTALYDFGQMRLTVLDRETQACPLCRITGIRTLPRHKLRNKIGGPGSFRGNRAFFSARATDNSAGRLHAGSQNCPIFHAPPSLFHGGVRLPSFGAYATEASRPFVAFAIRGTFRNRLPRGRTEHACHRLPCSERVHRRIHRGQKRPKKRVRTTRGRGCEASRPFGAYATEASSRLFAPCGAGSSAKLSGLPALLFCLVLEQVLRRILAQGAGGLQAGMPPQAGAI